MKTFQTYELEFFFNMTTMLNSRWIKNISFGKKYSYIFLIYLSPFSDTSSPVARQFRSTALFSSQSVRQVADEKLLTARRQCCEYRPIGKQQQAPATC